MKYPVNWQSLWKSLSIAFTRILCLGFIGFLAIEYISNDFDYEGTFKNIRPIDLPLWFLGFALGSICLAFLMAILLKLATIELSDNSISGLNYWYKRKTIPLNQIESLYRYNESGVKAIVVDGGEFGKVYISTHTNGLNDIINILSNHCSTDDI
ncbi:hypothetical protein [Pseudocolwellia agarivorans]|uniref:hypothetical protein n=1 Tax=Pseudocolwellia agarivorans TaxID=1911682 RepID=UPI003F885E79